MIADILVILSLAAVAVGRIPRLHINRSGLALVGAVLLVLSGSLTLEQALEAIDAPTLVLLFAMMVFNANLRLSGFFRWAGHILQRAGKPILLLATVMGVSALMSALFINDTAVVMLTPLVLETTAVLSFNPIPYLLGLALSSNSGSMASPLGNPQNILIASASGLGFPEFLGSLGVPALVNLLMAFGLLKWLYRKDFLAKSPFLPGSFRAPPVYKPLLYKSLGAFGVMVICWFFHLPLAIGALAGISLLLITRRIKPDKIFQEVDFSLLVLFSGLFVITKAATGTETYAFLLSLLGVGSQLNNWTLGWFASGLSQLISNVPAVMVLLPVLGHMSYPTSAALALAATTTLAGNFTLLGSVANLIVAEGARKKGIHLGFLEYFRAGGLLTLVGIFLTLLWFQINNW